MTEKLSGCAIYSKDRAAIFFQIIVYLIGLKCKYQNDEFNNLMDKNVYSTLILNGIVICLMFSFVVLILFNFIIICLLIDCFTYIYLCCSYLIITKWETFSYGVCEIGHIHLIICDFIAVKYFVYCKLAAIIEARLHKCLNIYAPKYGHENVCSKLAGNLLCIVKCLLQTCRKSAAILM